MVDSWEAHHSSSQQMLQPPSHGDGGLNLNNRTPSFFQSPSLVCMSGLGITDPYEAVQDVDEEKKEYTPHRVGSNSNHQVSEHVDATSGWGGMGLRGNHSYTNLHRTMSGGSGIFFGEDSENEQEDDKMPTTGSWSSKVGAPGTPGISAEGYIKTSRMSNLYYRKSASHGDLADDVNDEDKTHDDRGRPLSASMVAK